MSVSILSVAATKICNSHEYAHENTSQKIKYIFDCITIKTTKSDSKLFLNSIVISNKKWLNS